MSTLTPPFPGWRLVDPVRLAAFSACGPIREATARTLDDHQPTTFPPSAAWFAAKPERMALHRKAIAKAKADACDFATALRVVLAEEIDDAEDDEREAAIESMLRGAGNRPGVPMQDAAAPPVPPVLYRHAEGFRAASPELQPRAAECDQVIDAMLRGARTYSAP